MENFDAEISAALSGNGEIDRETVVAWIDSAADLRTLCNLYRLTGEGYYRIQPELGSETTCALIQRYLLECMRQDVKDDEEIEDRWAAAATLHLWLRHLVGREDTSATITRVAKAITELFLTGDEDIRNAIEMGFLEHALETVTLRPYFENWSLNSELDEAWKRALEWGKAHPDYTWNLLQGSPRPKKE